MNKKLSLAINLPLAIFLIALAISVFALAIWSFSANKKTNLAIKRMNENDTLKSVVLNEIEKKKNKVASNLQAVASDLQADEILASDLQAEKTEQKEENTQE